MSRVVIDSPTHPLVFEDSSPLNDSGTYYMLGNKLSPLTDNNPFFRTAPLKIGVRNGQLFLRSSLDLNPTPLLSVRTTRKEVDKEMDYKPRFVQFYSYFGEG